MNVWNREQLSTQERLRLVQTLASLRRTLRYARTIEDLTVRGDLVRELEILVAYMRIRCGIEEPHDR